MDIMTDSGNVSRIYDQVLPGHLAKAQQPDPTQPWNSLYHREQQARLSAHAEAMVLDRFGSRIKSAQASS